MNFTSMNPLTKHVLRATCAAALALAGMGQAHAENHALIMWIGDYANPLNNLPGIDKDAANARKIAKAMGIADANIVEVSNSQLSAAGMKNALNQLTSRIRKDDKVFIYFSGHGGQEPGQTASGCSEGMVAFDGSLYYDRELQADLNTLGSKASQIVMLNDSCFSGGAATKNLSGGVAKAYTGTFTNSKSGSNYTCGNAINKMSRDLSAAASRNGGGMVYLSASSDREIALATNQGSAATLGWAQCISARADTTRDGVINAEEFRQCAQNFISGRFNQTISLVGDGRLPILFDLPDAASAAPVVARDVLDSIAAGADRNLQVNLSTSAPRLSISKKDKMEFSVTTPQAGYLYLLHVGSSGKSFDVLFPNQFDKNEYLNAGTHKFPRAGWDGLEANGPEGKSYIMAYFTSQRVDLTKGMGQLGPYKSATVNAKSAGDLGVAASKERYGTSQVLAIEEVR